MRKIFVLVMAFISFNVSAQDVYTSSGRPVNAKKREQRKTGFDSDNLIFGGGLNLQFGQVTNLGIAPVIGYRFTDKFSAGVGLGYTFFRIKDYFQIFNKQTGNYDSKNFDAHSFSASVWARYLVLENLFVHVEPEYFMLRYKDYENYASDPVKVTEDAPCMLVGVGYRFPVSDRVSFVGMLLYDVLQDKFSPYGNQIATRFGLAVGF